MEKKIFNFKSNYSAIAVWCVLLSFSLYLVGCSSISTQQRNQLAQLRYPDSNKNETNKDIVVVRDGKDINLVNRTPRVYTDMQLWLNKQYVHKVKKLSIGTNNHFNLTTFINRYRQSFPVGQFLAPDKADDLVLAELYNPKTKKTYRLLVLDPLKVDNAARSRGQKLEDMH